MRSHLWCIVLDINLNDASSSLFWCVYNWQWWPHHQGRLLDTVQSEDNAQLYHEGQVGEKTCVRRWPDWRLPWPLLSVLHGTLTKHYYILIWLYFWLRFKIIVTSVLEYKFRTRFEIDATLSYDNKFIILWRWTNARIWRCWIERQCIHLPSNVGTTNVWWNQAC